MKKTVILLFTLLCTAVTGQVGAESLTVSAIDPVANQTKAVPEVIHMTANYDNALRGEEWSNQNLPATDRGALNSFSGKTVDQAPIPSKVPEPATMLLLGIGLTVMASFGRRVLKK